MDLRRLDGTYYLVSTDGLLGPDDQPTPPTLRITVNVDVDNPPERLHLRHGLQSLLLDVLKKIDGEVYGR